MTRVLHVTESLAAGGIETTFLGMLRAWRNGSPWGAHDVLAFAGGPLEPAYRDAARTVTVTASQDRLEQAVQGDYDVIYVLFERCAYRLLPFIAGQTRTPVVYGKGYDMSGMFRVDAGLAWLPDDSMMWGADATTFTTAALLDAFEAPPGRRDALGKAADTRSFLAVPPIDAATPMRIVCVANLHARKRLGDLLVAAAALRSSFPDLRVRFVGADDGREAARLTETAVPLGFDDACEIVGRHVDVGEDLAASRVFALPSGCEGVPTAMLEAMAAGRPVVVTDIGHIRGVVTDGVEGFLVEPGDIGAMTDRLRLLLTDRDLAARMGAAGRERARAHDTQAVAARLRSVLERAARGMGRRPGGTAVGVGGRA